MSSKGKGRGAGKGRIAFKPEGKRGDGGGGGGGGGGGAGRIVVKRGDGGGGGGGGGEIPVIIRTFPTESYTEYTLKMGDSGNEAGSRKQPFDIIVINPSEMIPSRHFKIWTNTHFDQTKYMLLKRLVNQGEIRSYKDLKEWIDEFQLNQHLCELGIIKIKIHAFWVFINGVSHKYDSSNYQSINFAGIPNEYYTSPHGLIQPYFLVDRAQSFQRMVPEERYNHDNNFDLSVLDYCTDVSKYMFMVDSSVFNLLLTLNNELSFIDVEESRMVYTNDLCKILEYDNLDKCAESSAKFMYLIIILTAFIYRNKIRNTNEYKHFSYVTPEKIESCLLDADLIVFIAKNVAQLQNEINNIHKNAANTLAHYGTVYSKPSTINIDPFQQMHQSLQHINLSDLENVGHPHHNWYYRINSNLSTVTLTKDVINVTIQLLICVLSVVYGQTSIYVKPPKKCVKSASASAHESNSTCAISGGKRRRKTKYRKPRKNKLSKKTHRRSRK